MIRALLFFRPTYLWTLLSDWIDKIMFDARLAEAKSRVEARRPAFFSGSMLPGEALDDLRYDEFELSEREYEYVSLLKRIEYAKTREYVLRLRNADFAYKGMYGETLRRLDAEIRQLMADERIERQVAAAFGLTADRELRIRHCPSVYAFAE